MLNSILRNVYFPDQWKVSQIITILKPGKPAEEVTSYRPISLLLILSKLFEKILLTQIKPIPQEIRIIPEYQFSFRQKHTTTEQVHRITNIIYKALESNKYCTAALLDSSQDFSKVWHEGLLHKIKTLFPYNIYQILKSYPESRYFLLKYREEYTYLCLFLSGVPQDSAGSLLYLLYTADLPTAVDSTTATFGGDTAVLTTQLTYLLRSTAQPPPLGATLLS